MAGQEHRVAIVTGAGSGVGRASALALARDGYIVALLGRRRGVLEETAGRAGTVRQALVIPTDVTVEAEVQSAFAEVIERAGRLDVLFNNAGGNVPATPIESLSLADWQRVVDVNLTGMFLCAREAVRCMKSQEPSGGRIINNGSVSAQVPRPHAVAYTATKHAVAGLTKSIALDGRSLGIAASQIDIGNAETPMTERMSRGVLQADMSLAPEPTMDVDHVARAVLYMANLPLDANVLTMTVMATKMPLAGRG